MLLIAWRNSKNLTVAQAAAYCGVAVGTFSMLERGLALPEVQTLFHIEGATRGAVTAVDHAAAWRNAHPQKFHQFREAGRSSAKAYRPPAKTRKKRIS